jgi:hypothetical protein
LVLCLWMQDGEWEVRIDSPHVPSDKRHVHIRRIRKRKGEYSWNEDGTRRHENKFPASEKDINRARAIAAERLRVDPGILRLVTSAPAPCATVVISEDDNLVALLELRVQTSVVVLGTDEWMAIIGLSAEAVEGA